HGVDFGHGFNFNNSSPLSMRRLIERKLFVCFSLSLIAAGMTWAGELSKANKRFVEKYCAECHDAETKKGGLDLTGLEFDLASSTNFSKWVLVHDRVSKGEMPPKKKARPEKADLEAFTNSLASALNLVERAQFAKKGRATRRRLNRYEYENALRDLLHAPWLQIKDSLPEDGERDRFNKVGDAL